MAISAKGDQELNSLEKQTKDERKKMNKLVRVLVCGLVVNLHLGLAAFADGCGQEPTNVSKDNCEYIGEGGACSETVAAISLWCKTSTEFSKCNSVFLDPALTVPTDRYDGFCEYDNGVLKCLMTSAHSSLIITNVKTTSGTCEY